jgi:glycosyltransferase involved in cell wall biosynthesis
LARDVAAELNMPIKVVSGLSGDEKWLTFAGAAVLLHPSQNRAAPRLPVELAYCGVPTVCLAGDGTEHIVKDGLTGYVAHDKSELADAVLFAMELDRQSVYDHIKAHHDYDDMIDAYEQVLIEVANGSRF